MISRYLEALQLAAKNNFESVALPVIEYAGEKGQGVFALETALDSVREFLQNHDINCSVMVR